jgi:hypothetical protein
METGKNDNRANNKHALSNDENKKGQEALRELATLLRRQQEEGILDERNEKLKRVLLLLAGGAALATAVVMPGTTRLFKHFLYREKSDWDEWKMFNKKYLRQTIQRLEREKIIEIEDQGEYGVVKITDKGKQKILQFGTESLTIKKPARWDGKWRLVVYDIFSARKSLRDRFQKILKGAGFYPFQESVYLHAYPCEQQVEFLRAFLGIEGEVRLITATGLENDQAFRQYYGL